MQLITMLSVRLWLEPAKSTVFEPVTSVPSFPGGASFGAGRCRAGWECGDVLHLGPGVASRHAVDDHGPAPAEDGALEGRVVGHAGRDRLVDCSSFSVPLLEHVDEPEPEQRLRLQIGALDVCGLATCTLEGRLGPPIVLKGGVGRTQRHRGDEALVLQARGFSQGTSGSVLSDGLLGTAIVKSLSTIHQEALQRPSGVERDNRLAQLGLDLLALFGRERRHLLFGTRRRLRAHVAHVLKQLAFIDVEARLDGRHLIEPGAVAREHIESEGGGPGSGCNDAFDERSERRGRSDGARREDDDQAVEHPGHGRRERLELRNEGADPSSCKGWGQTARSVRPSSRSPAPRPWRRRHGRPPARPARTSPRSTNGTSTTEIGRRFSGCHSEEPDRLENVSSMLTRQP
ncbi:MAG: hypothetical protein IPG04_31620 [Polyangiaceae bacterium]|nr:hypothetical protein [Polyangiaceae bacterium]